MQRQTHGSAKRKGNISAMLCLLKALTQSWMSRSGVAARMVITGVTPDLSSSMLLRAGLSPPCMAGSAPPWGPHRHPSLSLVLTAPETAPLAYRSINQSITAPETAPLAYRSINQSITAPETAPLAYRSINQSLIIPCYSRPPVLRLPRNQAQTVLQVG